MSADESELFESIAAIMDDAAKTIDAERDAFVIGDWAYANGQFTFQGPREALSEIFQMVLLLDDEDDREVVIHDDPQLQSEAAPALQAKLDEITGTDLAVFEHLVEHGAIPEDQIMSIARTMNRATMQTIAAAGGTVADLDEAGRLLVDLFRTLMFSATGAWHKLRANQREL